MQPKTCDRPQPTSKLATIGLQSRAEPQRDRSARAHAPIRRYAAMGGVAPWLLATAVVLLVCAGWRSIAHAQASSADTARDEGQSVDVEARNTTMARALFDEGLRFVDAEQWEQAQDRFGRVLSLRYSAVAAYNYGLALARLGRGVVAASALRRLLTDVNLDATVHEHASALLRDVEARFAWLNVRVQGECQGCNVYLNERLWPWPAVGVFVPVDAGQYALRLRLGNAVVAEQRLAIAETERVEATLIAGGAPALALNGEIPSAPGGQRPIAGSTAPGAISRHSLLLNGWFWGAMGVLFVGAGGMIVLAAQ